MKIAIASTGRFHVLDLARELARLGHDVRFYSYVPASRARKFGLAPEFCVSVLPYVFPLVALALRGPRPWRRVFSQVLSWVMDWIVAWRLQPCDLFIGMSGVYVRASLAARSRYGARVYTERGSRHILSQKEILEDLRSRGVKVETVPPFVERRELQMYEEAEMVVVPSRHVEQSFLARGVPARKIFRNPYGVELADFQPTPSPDLSIPTAIFVGTWSYRKGVDILADAWRHLQGVRLLHVGPNGDAPMPAADWFTHVDPVDQKSLVRYYAQAHLFVLASREEGLSLVIPQALSCGLPVVCTDRTGGEDLQEFLVAPSLMAVVPSGDAAAFAAAVKSLMPKAMALSGLRDLIGAKRPELSWAAYGRRYHEHLTKSPRA